MGGCPFMQYTRAQYGNYGFMCQERIGNIISRQGLSSNSRLAANPVIEPGTPTDALAPFSAVPCGSGRGVRSTLNCGSSSLDNLVGAHQHRLRHGEAKRLGGLEVDDQLEGRRLLDRQIGGLGAPWDLFPVNADPAEGRKEAWALADQAARRGEHAPPLARR